MIVWDNNPSYTAAYNSATSQPSADLDLALVGPNGATVSTSSSFDNNYEIVDYTATTSGTYKLRVNKYRCNADPKFMSWAWHRVN